MDINERAFVTFYWKDSDWKPKWQHPEAVRVLVGEGGASVTGGYGGWEAVGRTRRRSLVRWAGFEPLTISVPIVFGAQFDLDGGAQCEREITQLENMAGRGVRPRPPKRYRVKQGDTAKTIARDLLESSARWREIAKANPAAKIRDPNKPLKKGLVLTIPQRTPLAQGEPPIIRMYLDGGTAVPLGYSPTDWVITGIEWEEAVRNTSGNRIRQTGTVTVQQFIQDVVVSAAVRRKQRKKK